MQLASMGVWCLLATCQLSAPSHLILFDGPGRRQTSPQFSCESISPVKSRLRTPRDVLRPASCEETMDQLVKRDGRGGVG